jgi:hypothetical protein
MLTDLQPVNAGRDLAVLARLLDAWTDVGVPQRDAVFGIGRDWARLCGHHPQIAGIGVPGSSDPAGHDSQPGRWDR